MAIANPIRSHSHSRSRSGPSSLSNARYASNLHAERRFGPPCVAPGSRLGHATLVSWLSSQAVRPATLFAAVDMLHRSLRPTLSVRCAQRLARVCLRLAMKVHEVLSDGVYRDVSDVTVRDELRVAKTLGWKLLKPTPYTFFVEFAHRLWMPDVAKQQALAYLRACLYHVDVQEFYPSTLALMAIAIVDRQGLLPLVSKSILAQVVGSEVGREREVNEALRRFELRLTETTTGSPPSPENSSTTTYASASTATASSPMFSSFYSSSSPSSSCSSIV